MIKDSKVLDPEIRRSLRPILREFGDIYEEKGVDNGLLIADMIVINEKIHAFEIKSDGDSLNRLKFQIRHYNQCFDFVTIVCTKEKLKRILRMVPGWWGIYLYEDRKIALHRIKSINPEISVSGLSRHLWKSQLYKELRRQGIRKISKLSKVELREITPRHFTIKSMRTFVRKVFQECRQ